MIIDGVAVYEHKVIYPRSAIVVDERYNPRDDYIGIEQIATSLELRSQLQPIYATPVGDRQVAVRDGYTRIRCVDTGLCPKFAEKDEWKIIILHDGPASPGKPLKPLPERIIRRYCATINRHRRNWTELEEGRYFQAEVEETLALELLAYNERRRKEQLPPVKELPAGEYRKLRRQVVEALAQDEGITTVTVNERIKLLELPASIRKALRKRLIPISTAKQFHGVEDEEARRLLSGLVQQQGYELDWTALDREQPFLRKLKLDGSAPDDGGEKDQDEGDGEEEEGGGGQRFEGDVPDPTKSLGVIPKPENKKQIRRRGRLVPLTPPDGVEGNGAAHEEEEESAPETPPAEEPTDPEADAINEVKRGLRKRHVVEAMNATGTTNKRRRRKANRSPRKMRRSDDELTGAILHYEEQKKSGDAKAKTQATFAMRLLRYVVGETDTLP